jgi:HSP20 family molecular chaperone IbpA
MIHFVSREKISSTKYVKLKNEGGTKMTALKNFFNDPFFSPFDVSFRNLMRRDLQPAPLANAKLGLPVDVWSDESGLNIEIVLIEAEKENIKVTNPAGTDKIKISYKKGEHSIPGRNYICKGISRKDVDLEFYVDDKQFNLRDVEVTYRENILKINLKRLEQVEPEVTEYSIQ